MIRQDLDSTIKAIVRSSGFCRLTINDDFGVLGCICSAYDLLKEFNLNKDLLKKIAQCLNYPEDSNDRAYVALTKGEINPVNMDFESFWYNDIVPYICSITPEDFAFTHRWLSEFMYGWYDERERMII